MNIQSVYVQFYYLHGRGGRIGKIRKDGEDRGGVVEEVATLTWKVGWGIGKNRMD